MTLEDVLTSSDFVSMHVPLTPQTHHMIDEEQLRMMKPTAYLVNTSRGPVVDEEALYKALKEGWIAGAALDVHEEDAHRPGQPAPGARQHYSDAPHRQRQRRDPDQDGRDSRY